MPPPQFAAAYHYDERTTGVRSVMESAMTIVPIINRIFQPSSVVDLGCGTGDWLQAWRNAGATNLCGVDGSWIPRSSSYLGEEEFMCADLNKSIPQLPKADLAMCLEVAEHLPFELSEQIVRSLCECAPVVVWSAAVPSQGGYGHVNEQYQDFWVKKFGEQGYIAHDLVRPKVWMNPLVSWWYQQNLLIFVSPAMSRNLKPPSTELIPNFIHPILLERSLDPMNYSMRKLIKVLPRRLFEKLSRLFQSC